MKYVSTRGTKEYTASEAILQGLCEDGGLFMPEYIPQLSVPLSKLPDLSYQDLAYLVMKDYLSDFTEAELRECIEKAYDEKFDDPRIAVLKQADDHAFLELFHGATIAFKDMALSLLPHLLTTAKRKQGVKEEIVILTATSGDTGKAALEGFRDVEGTRIIVFYPHGGVSAIQELQMVTTGGKNTKVISVRGNFDDCQTGVKQIFSDAAFGRRMEEKGFRFSSANSINIGRLIPQVAYYVYAYAGMMKCGAIKEGEPLNFTVPTGNFGNILAAYFAKQMGLPVGKLICASNDNKVLFDFFTTGIYDRNRPFILTSSPSMDILISSNLERLIYLMCDRDPEKNRALMEQLKTTGRYEVSEAMREKTGDFYGGFASSDKVTETIRVLFEKTGYVIDPHTAVAFSVACDYEQKEKPGNKNVIVSTASPYKFGQSVLKAIDPSFTETDPFAMADRLHERSGVLIPPAIESIRNADIRHRDVCDVSSMEDLVAAYLNI